jgi:lysophospholipase L1-like esterase
MSHAAPPPRRWTIRSTEAASSGFTPARIVAIVVVGASASVALCCAETPAPTQPVVATSSASSPAPSASIAYAAPTPSAVEAIADAGADASALEVVERSSKLPELSHFFAALRGLETTTRKEHVRIAWLGDSHGAGDYWSGALRTALQKRFGDGGPGFLHLGYKGTRHDGARLSIDGKWSLHPAGPSTTRVTGDGVFGLGGVMMSPTTASDKASVTIEPAPKRLLWDVCYRATTPRDAIEVTLSPAKSAKNIAATKATTPIEAPGPVRHLALTSEDQPTLSVHVASGSPFVCGAIAERDPKDSVGVVLDTLGINGARLATPLAWDAAAWQTELARRAPSLVILEYGTNETSDSVIKPESFAKNLAALMDRVHLASPTADCLVVSNTDRASTPDANEQVRDALRSAAAASHCAFWDTYATMGGRGAIVKWRAEDPARAGSDGVHLTARGYHDLGDALSAFVLGGYDARSKSAE